MFVSFMVLAIGFTYINLMSPAIAPSVTTAAEGTADFELLAFLRLDWTRTVILLVLTLLAYLLFHAECAKKQKDISGMRELWYEMDEEPGVECM